MTEPTTLRVYRGADGQFTLYEDDGISQEYLQGKGSWTRIAWNDREGQLTIEPGAPRGASNVVAERAFKVQVLPDGATEAGDLFRKAGPVEVLMESPAWMILRRRRSREWFARFTLHP